MGGGNRDEAYFRAFVEDLFEGILGRPFDQAGLVYWMDRLRKGWSEAQVLRAFIECEERQAKRNPVPMWVPPGHFYSPIVDPAEVAIRWAEEWANGGEPLAGIPVDLDGMVAFWHENLAVIQSTPFPSTPSTGRYYFENNAFCHADAIMLRTMLHVLRPKRVIEVGSGFSTACMLDTRDELGTDGFSLTCIEPYPAQLHALMKPHDLDRVRILDSPVQAVERDLYQTLESGDILFIDSTHVLKTASDVHHHLFEVLPHVPAGVYVHFHDIFRRFEYPEDWAIRRNFSWNESYALRAFLMYNPNYRIIFFNDLFGLKQADLIAATCPDFLKNTGGSLWLRRE